MSENRSLVVYGQIENSLVYIPKEEALRLSRIHRALRESKTWADFIDIAGEDEYHAIVAEILEILGHTALYPNFLMGEDLSNYVDDLYMPQPEDPFTPDIIPGLEEGEYLSWPGQEMMAWLPEELMDEIGEIQPHPIHGFTFYIDPDMVIVVNASLAAVGFEALPDASLVEAACGLGD